MCFAKQNMFLIHSSAVVGEIDDGSRKLPVSSIEFDDYDFDDVDLALNSV